MPSDPNIIYTGETSPNDDLIGKRYIDLHDSGDQVMAVAIVDAIDPDRVVWVHPVDYPQRSWWRNAALLRPLIAAYEFENHKETPDES